jgi:TRAP-type C4-dicarboxylate transport system substrate-binding protein
VIEGIARRTQEYVYRTAEKMDTDLLAELKASGMQVNEADRESFVEASKDIFERFGRLVPGGTEWVAQALALAGD